MLRYIITRAGLAAIGKNGFRTAGREAIEATGLYWWTKYLPLHFLPIAYLRYGYGRRDAATDRKKRERLPFLEGVGDQTPALGFVAPLVFSGRSRERALDHPNLHARAKSFDKYSCQVVIDAPAFNFKHGDKIDPRDEVTRVTDQENKTLNDVFTEEFNASLRAVGITAPPRVYRTAA